MMPERTSPTSLPAFSTTIIGLSIVLSTAAFFRLYRLAELMVFATDQGRAMLAGRNILLGHWQATGPLTSVPWLHLGPFYYYLTAFSLWLSHFDPLGPAVMTALFGVAAAAALFLFTQRYWGGVAAVTAGLLLAVSPLAVAQSRIAIEPSPLPFFTIVWLWLTAQWLETKQRRWLAASLGTILLSIQLNFSAVAFLPIMATAWLITNRRLVPDRKKLLFWTGGFVLLAESLARSNQGPTTAPEYLGSVWRLLTAPNSLIVATTLLAVFLAGLCQVRHRAQAKAPVAVLVFAWVTLGFLAFLLKQVSGEHSLALLFPAGALLMALGLEPLRKKIGLQHLILLVAGVLFLSGQTSRYVFASQLATRADHQRVTDKVLELAGSRPYNLVYRGHLDVYDAADDHYQYLLWLSGHSPSDSARIELRDEYREQWLLEQTEAQKTIYLYYPWTEADRYPSIGTRTRFENVILEVIE